MYQGIQKNCVRGASKKRLISRIVRRCLGGEKSRRLARLGSTVCCATVGKGIWRISQRADDASNFGGAGVDGAGEPGFIAREVGREMGRRRRP